jgi:predicted oxidoreductase
VGLLLGANFTVTVQVAPGASAAVQLLALTWYAGGSVLTGFETIVIDAAGTPLAAPPLFVTVNA